MRDPKLIEIAERAAAYYGAPGGGFANSNRVNFYACQGRHVMSNRGRTSAPCGRLMITIDREPGVTPFLTSCPDCGGETQSRMYRVPQDMTPTHEWYRPDSFAGLSESTIEHVRNGGLLIRKIVQEPAS